MYAYKLQRVDYERDLHLTAWLNQQVQAVKKDGKTPRFKKFSEFYDYAKNIKEIESHMDKTKAINPKLKRMAKIAKLVNKGGR